MASSPSTWHGLARELLSGLSAAAAFVGLYVATTMPIWLDAVLAGSVLVALQLLLPASPAAVPPPDCERALAAAQRDAAALRGLARSSLKPAVADNMQRIAASVENALERVGADQHARAALADFLGIYVGRTLGIARKYTELSALPHATTEQRDRLEQIENILKLGRQAFDSQVSRLIDRDLAELGADARAFEEMLMLEGPIQSEGEHHG
ncbi:MAG: 5-bromo-4-chloroindolyl phosphate hydrolysis family protein [Candidatus Schekmanbacteria bacterium]|nr:5-bromo-4-chloroindolyl phosphate hydrolysis family protein [Candidatus Schekmanbacteria bacterium]